MQEFKIKTWSCSKCNYKQDFEPTEENQLKYFGRTSHFVGGNVCPSCGEQLDKEMVEDKKIKMMICEVSDKIDIENNGVVTGQRGVEKGEYLTSSEIQLLREKYEDK